MTRAAGNAHGEAALLQGLGQVGIYLDEMADARRNLHTCLRLYRGIGDRRDTGLALASIGTVHRVLGEALRVDVEAVDHLAAVWHGQAEAQVRTAIGLIRFDQGYPEAGSWIEEGLLIARRLGDRHRQAVILRTLSRYQQGTGDTSASLRSLAEALTIFNEINDERCAAYTEQRLGAVYAELGDTSRAGSALERAAHVFRLNDDCTNEAACWHELGEVEALRGEVEAARHHLGLALGLWEITGPPERAADARKASKQLD